MYWIAYDLLLNITINLEIWIRPFSSPTFNNTERVQLCHVFRRSKWSILLQKHIRFYVRLNIISNLQFNDHGEIYVFYLR